MDLMKGKKGIIFGVSNTHGIAYGIAKQLFDEGADIAFTYAGEAMEKRVKPIAESMNAKLIMSCDVTKEEEVEAVAESFLACCIASLLTYTGVTTTDCFSICSKSSLGNNCA